MITGAGHLSHVEEDRVLKIMVAKPQINRQSRLKDNIKVILEK